MNNFGKINAVYDIGFNTNPGVGRWDYYPDDFPELLRKWTQIEGNDLSTEAFLAKIGLDYVLDVGRLNSLILRQAVPDQVISNIMSLHLPGYGLRPDEPLTVELPGPIALRNKARKWRGDHPSLPLIAISKETYHAFRASVLDRFFNEYFAISSQEEPLEGTLIQEEIEENLTPHQAVKERIIQATNPAGQQIDEEIILERLVAQYRRKSVETIEGLVGIIRDKDDTINTAKQVTQLHEEIKAFFENLVPQEAILSDSQRILPPSAKALRFLRSDAELSIEELSKRIGIGRGAITQWELGEFQIHYSKRSALINLLCRSNSEEQKFTFLLLPALDLKWLVIQPEEKQAGLYLRALRKRAALSHAELSKEIDVAQATISRWEEYKRSIDCSKLTKLTQTLGCSEVEKQQFTFLLLPALNPEWLAIQPEEKQAGLYLRDLKKKAGLSHAKLSNKVGVAKATISHWETGIHTINSEILLDIITTIKATGKVTEGEIQGFENICALSYAARKKMTGKDTQLGAVVTVTEHPDLVPVDEKKRER